MQEANSLTTRQLLERMDRRDARMDRRMDRMELEHRELIRELAGISKQLTLLLNRQDDRINRLESRV